MAIQFSNLASTSLASGVSSSATSISVTSASSFPSLGSGDYFYATLGAGTGSEIVKVTAISGTTFTVVRGQDGTTAVSHSAGGDVALRVTAGTLEDLRDGGQVYTAGSGLGLSGNEFTNTAPDQTVSISGSGSTTVTGTYPSFTVSSTSYSHPSAHPISFITGLQTALDGKVDDSQVLTDVPANALFTDTVYTLPFTDNSSNWNTAYGWGDHSTAGYLTSHQSLSGYATETYVGTQITNLVDSAPATMDTLNELAAALGDDPNFATTVSTSIGTKLPLAGGTLTGALSGTTASFSGNLTSSGYLNVSTIYNTGDYRILNNGGTAWHDVVTRGNGDNYTVNALGGFKVGSTTVIDSSRTHFSGIKGYATTATGNTSITASTGIKQTYSEGWTAIFADYDPHHEWGLYHDNPSNYFLITGGVSTNNIGSFSVVNHAGSTRTAYTKIRLDQNTGEIRAGGGYYVGNTQVLDTSRNLTNIGNATFSGSVTAPSIDSQQYRLLQGSVTAGGIFKERTITGAGVSNDVSIFAESISDGGEIHLMTGGSATKKFTFTSGGNFQVGGTTVIDASRNLTNIGSITTDDHISIKNAEYLYFGQSTASEGSWKARLYAPSSTLNINAQAINFNNLGYGSSTFFVADSTGFDIQTGSLQIGGTTVIDSSREIKFTKGSSGTLASRTGFSDFIGYNPSYGSYIGGGANNANSWIYSGGYISQGGVHTLWHSGNDGSGSGLDADLLDGNHASAFVTTTTLASNDRIYISDTRGANRDPSYYDDRYVQADFSQSVYFGVSGGDSWATALTVSKWSTYDPSHRQEQLIFAGTKLARRVATSDSGWSSAHTIWDSSTDGSGSGLDADLLDGNNSGAFLKSGAGHSVSGWWISAARNGNSSGTMPHIYLSHSGGYGMHINTYNTSGSVYALELHNNSNELFAVRNNGDIKVSGTTRMDLSGNSYFDKRRRFDHHTGHLEGSYNNVGANANKSNPIYTIGSSYNPADSSLANMYGIGFCDSGASFINGALNTGGWGMYVAADGDARVWLEASQGRVVALSDIRAPIFYDSNDTGYYLNPQSTSVLDRVDFGGSQQGWRKYGTHSTSGHSVSSISFDWDANYDDATYHGIMSTNSVGTYGDNLSINSYNDISMRLDANDNNPTSYFRIYNNSATNGNEVFYLDSNAACIVPGSFRAPIFYDNNDSGYYVDPASTSRMVHLRLSSNDSYLKIGTDGATTTTRDGNRPQIEIGANHAYPHLTLQSYGTNTTHGGVISFRSRQGSSGFRRWNIGTANYNPDSIQIGYFDNNDNPHYGVGVNGWTYDSYARFVIRTDYSEARGSMRSPIFYDLNNTGYYLDPASSGVSANFNGRIQVGTFAPSQSNSGEAWIGRATDRTQGTLSVQLGTGSGRKFEVVDAGWTTVEFSADDSGNATAATSMRAPVFYDSANTGYYVDPLQTSSMNYIAMPHRGNGTENIRVNNGQQENWRAINVAMGGSNNAGIGYGNNTRSVFNRHNLAFHVSQYDSIRFHSDGWDTLFEVAGASGDAWLKGQLQAKQLHLAGASNTSYASPNIKSYGSSNSGGVANYHMKFMALNGNANGSISTNYYQTTYATTSDYRVKEDLQPMVNATNRLMSLNPVNFQWKDSDMRTDGFIAHEVAEVVTDAVVGEKDAVDEQGNDDLQALDQSKLIPLLVKTIQEQQSVIEALEARISALEA